MARARICYSLGAADVLLKQVVNGMPYGICLTYSR
jgi:hypothetical protein